MEHKNNRLRKISINLNDEKSEIKIKKMASIFYGWQDVRPKKLQWLNRPQWFLVFAALAVFVQSMSVNGLISVSISTLEQRFGWTSKQAGLLPSFYDIFGLPAVIVISYFGNKANKPRWIASGMFLIAIGSILFAMPHFFTGLYFPSGSGAENELCNIARDGRSFLNTTCDGTTEILGNDSSVNWYYLYMFLASIFFLGIGSVPLYVLALTYFDDCLPRDTAAMYVGIFYACGTFGPAVAFLLGGYMLNIHTDIDQGITESMLSTTDPRWVGAWWLLFLVAGALALLLVVPLYGFPRMMSTYEEVRKNRINETHANVAVTNTSSNSISTRNDTSFKNMPSTLLSLFKNPTFVAMLLAGVGDVAMISGFVAFGPKYMQNQFSMSAASTGMVFGLIAIPGAAGGSFIGSYLIKKLNMTCKQCLKWQFWISVVALLFLGLFLIQCKQPPFIGVNIDNQGRKIAKSEIDIKSNCSSGCNCNHYTFDPVCGDNGNTYFSACHAGCMEHKSDDLYKTCNCIKPLKNINTKNQVRPSNTTGTATTGMCTEKDCNYFWLFCIVFFGAMFLIYVTGMFHLSILVRIVPDSQRDLALGLDMIASRVIGSIPSPIVFGAIIDTSCLLWERRKCNENNGNCIYYANADMSWSMLILCIFCQALVTLTCFIAYKSYKQCSSKSLSTGLDNMPVFENSMIDPNDPDDNQKTVHLRMGSTNSSSGIQLQASQLENQQPHHQPHHHQQTHHQHHQPPHHQSQQHRPAASILEASPRTPGDSAMVSTIDNGSRYNYSNAGTTPTTAAPSGNSRAEGSSRTTVRQPKASTTTTTTTDDNTNY